MPVWQTKRIRQDSDRLQIYPYSTRLTPQKIPSAGLCDLPYVCLKINSEWAGHVAGALAILTYTDAWSGTPEESAAAVEEVERIIDMLIPFCQGDDMSLILYDQQQQTIQNQLLAAYDGSLGSIDDDAPDHFGSDTGDTPPDAVNRDRALCYAVNALVDMICAQVLKQLNEKQIAITIIAGIIGLIVGGGIIGGVFLIATNFILGVTKEPFQNEEARQNVACCIIAVLNDLPTTQSNLQSAGNVCYPSPTQGDEYFVAQALRSSNYTSTGNFVAFVKTLAEGFRLAELGLLEPCPCEVWEYEFYDGFGEPPASLITYDSGTYNALEDRVDGENESQAGGYDVDVARLMFNFPLPVSITRVLLTAAAAAPNGQPFEVDSASIRRDEPLPVYVYDQYLEYGQHGPEIYELDSGDVSDDVTVLRFTCQGGYPDGNPTGAYGRLLYIKIAGTGYNPFEGLV